MRFKSGLVSGQRLLRPQGTDLSASQTADEARGAYLCEVCEELMTDDVLPAAESPSGLELAICSLCSDTSAEAVMPLHRHDSYGRPLPRLADTPPQDLTASATNLEQRERIFQLIRGMLDEHYPYLLRREVTAEVTLTFTVRAGTIQDDMYVGIVRKYRDFREGTGPAH